MAASVVTEARLRRMIERRDQPSQAFPVGPVDRARLSAALLAHDSGRLGLPPSSTFEPALSKGTEQPLSGAAAELFSSHTAYQLPQESPGTDPDTVHRFVLAGSQGAHNDGLVKFGLWLERRARSSGKQPDECRHGTPDVLPPLGERRAAGVHVSNEGGYQSYPDLFDFADSFPAFPPLGCTWTEHERNALAQRSCPPTAQTRTAWARGRDAFCDEEVQGRRCCHALHHAASHAMDELQRRGLCGQSHKQVWGGHSVHAANAWLNVNRATDTNLMHRHNPLYWSATYYVAGSPQSEHILDGRLLFRGGGNVRSDGQAPATSHTYLSVPPVPGTLWVFPGSTPHRVLGMAGPSSPARVKTVGTRGMWAPRISVAINFTDVPVELLPWDKRA